MPEPARTTESLARLAVPVAISVPPVPNELRHPAFAPTGLLFAHGHAVPVPSPGQNAVPTVEGTAMVRMEMGVPKESTSRMFGKFGVLVHTTFNPIHVAPPFRRDCT